MKAHPLISILTVLFLFLSCSSEKSGQELVWEVGESQSSVVKIIKETDKSELTLKLDGSSFCTGFGIRIEVVADADTLYNERQDSLPTTLMIPLSFVQKNLEVTTSVESNNSGIDCFRLGNVNCTLSY